MTWRLVAFKPGYLTEGDEDVFEFDEYGWSGGNPRSIWDAWWLGPVVRVETIRMKPATFSLKEEAVYDQRFLGTGSCFRPWLSPEEIALVKTMRDAGVLAE